MSNDNKIPTGSGQFFAVNPSGHIVGVGDIKAGFRWATQDDLDVASKVERERQAKESKTIAPSGPIKVA